MTDSLNASVVPPPLPALLTSAAEVDAWLASCGFFHMELTLDRIRHCLTALGLDVSHAPTVQVVGTNGKGSTACFLAHIAAAQGLQVGLFTSPHLLHPRERMVLVDDFGLEPIPAESWVDAANAVLQTPTGPSLTYFERTLAMALWWFREEEVDLIVLEAGLGGGGDATTAAPREMLLVAPIGLDHADVIGPSLSAIAADKARAVPKNGLVLAVPQDPRAIFRLERVAAARKAQLFEVRMPRGFDPDFGFYPLPDPLAGEGPAPLTLGLPGPHQTINARLAMAAWLVLASRHDWPLDAAASREGLTRTWLPGRLQHAPAVPGRYPAMLLDAAHNAPALAILEQALARPTRGFRRPEHLVFTCLKDKDLSAMTPLLARIVPGRCIVPELPGSSRSLPAAEVVARLRPAFGDRIQAGGSLADVLAGMASPGAPISTAPVLCCGSLYLLAEFFKLAPHLLGPWQADP
ncbi:bifunctional folylpolyglutamate synthase/dihydrofolate synthase [Megalodesulfovibrio gigas]|uniref:Putative FolC protein n=1 Tax=Megalodesulfovibrio gigas (strain ATCC 19364 / DSM 1382 / NCIMB 9332 / VKM B-1759) TaxID=1121448 RepID=T2GBJ7_MEGG1|nr:putative FolC protein [Megalodesulfovibrio gigas]AGW13653.1 putative FolC protein [Megalodesulfovibrio gigas DSM 1382 = ATCC 19364]